MAKEQPTKDQPIYIKIGQVAHLFGISSDTFDEWVKQGKIQEGIHFVRAGSKMRLVNVELLKDRIANWNDDATHQQAIHVFSHSLLCSQPIKRSHRGK